MASLPAYKAVVFAGGGSRCFWQAGFWEAIAPALPALPEVITATSAGSSTACHAMAGCFEDAMRFYLEAHARRAKYGPPRPRFSLRPDMYGIKVYRAAFEQVLRPEHLARLHRGPEIRILMAKAPAWAPGALGTALGFAAYTLEKMLVQPLHPTWGQSLGFQPVVGLLNQCATAEQVADLVLASSCVPPMVPLAHWQGQPVLDGGLIDNAPLALVKPQERPTLIVLTRRYSPDKLRGHEGLTYVQPSAPPVISKWENANPDLLLQAVKQGMADGEKFLRHGPEALYS